MQHEVSRFNTTLNDPDEIEHTQNCIELQFQLMLRQFVSCCRKEGILKSIKLVEKSLYRAEERVSLFGIGSNKAVIQTTRY
jgi:hypothetical protein